MTREEFTRGAVAELRRAEQAGVEGARYHVARAQVYALLALNAPEEADAPGELPEEEE